MEKQWLPQPPALWRNVSGGSAGEDRTAQSANPGMPVLQRGVGYLEKQPPPITSPAPPPRFSNLPLWPPLEQIHCHTLAQTDWEAFQSIRLHNQEILTSHNATSWLYFLNEMFIWPPGYERSRWDREAKCAIHTCTCCCPRQAAGWWQRQTGRHDLMNGRHWEHAHSFPILKGSASLILLPRWYVYWQSY